MRFVPALAGLLLWTMTDALATEVWGDGIYVGGGAVATGISRYQNSAGLFHGVITLGARYSWLAPTLMVSPLGRESVDASTRSHLVALTIPATVRWGFLDFRAGLGMMGFLMSGGGGTVELNDGNSTSTFSRPGRWTLSSYSSLNGGLGFQIMRKLRLDIECWVSGPFSDRRAVNLAGWIHVGVL